MSANLSSLAMVPVDIGLHQSIFAQEIGVDPEEEFYIELTEYAIELLNDLPQGWRLVVGEEVRNYQI